VPEFFCLKGYLKQKESLDSRRLSEKRALDSLIRRGSTEVISLPMGSTF
jgi:hypothetical protein